jgi:hypothetical protein
MNELKDTALNIRPKLTNCKQLEIASDFLVSPAGRMRVLVIGRMYRL